MFDCFQPTVYHVQCDQRALLPAHKRTQTMLLLHLVPVCLAPVQLVPVHLVPVHLAPIHHVQSASCFPRAQASNSDAEGVQQRGKGRSAARQKARPCHPVHRAVALLSFRRKNNGGGGGGGGGGGVGKADSGKLNFVASARAEHCVNWVTVLGRMALDLVVSASAEGEVGITLLLPWTVCSALMTIFIHSSCSSSDSLSV
jgi:hypothetical protein